MTVPESSSAMVSDDGSAASDDSPKVTAQKKRGLFRRK